MQNKLNISFKSSPQRSVFQSHVVWGVTNQSNDIVIVYNHIKLKLEKNHFLQTLSDFVLISTVISGL